MKLHPIPLITICLFISLLSFSQQDPVHLRSGTFYPEKNINAQQIESFNRTSSRINGYTYAAVQFEKIPGITERQQLRIAGIELLEYISGKTYTVAISTNVDVNLLQRTNAISLFRLQPKQKMHPNLAKGIYPSWATRNTGMIELWISFPKTLSPSAVKQLLHENGISITTTYYQDYRIIGILIPKQRIEEVAALPFIDYIEPAPHGDQLLNKGSRNTSKANVLNAPVSVGGHDLNGEGIVIGIGDDADAHYHYDIRDRVINYGPASHAFHGTHVHGTVGGGGLLDEDHRGYARKSIMITQFLSDIIKNSATYVTDHGMVVTNNSYGDIVDDCSYAGTYDLLSRVLDLQAFSLPNLQHVYAIGNDGANSCPPYPASFHTALGGYQASKNIITVGAANRNGTIAFFSSRGPMNDGRIKPEVTADGNAVVSTVPGNIHMASSGTSMASPAIAGGVGLLYERYNDVNGVDPKSGLMKALICNGATDRGNAGPDFTYGFGGMNLLRSLDMLNNNRYVVSSISNLGQNDHVIAVPAGTAELKAMLYWQDEAGAVFAVHTLVNDLDLEVITPSATTLLPWKLDTTAANVNVAATTGADHINNIEQVSITSPAAGNYTIRVKGTLVPNTPHEYFVVYDFVPQETRITYPVGGEGMEPGENVTIQWESYGAPLNTFTLEYSTNNGGSWNTISSTVPADDRQFLWTVPSVVTHQALIRVTRNSTSFISTSNPFTIVARPSLALAATQCEGYFSFTWGAITGATDYEVFMRSGAEMISIATTASTSHTLSGLDPSQLYLVAVAARVSGSRGKRSLGLFHQPNVGTCAGTISDNDIRIDSIVAPLTGRLNTSSALTAATPIVVRIKNLDDANVTSFNMRYSINGGGLITEPVVATIAPGAFYTHTFTTTANMSAAGSYILVADVVNTTGVDPVTANNALADTIRQLNNAVVALPFSDDLESLDSRAYRAAYFGIRGNDRYDYTNTSSWGRLSTALNSSIPFSGANAFSLDLDGWNGGTGNSNFVYGTFNLNGINAATQDIRLDFQLKTHGDSVNHAHNRVWIRGNDTQPWLEAFVYSSNAADRGVFKKTPSLELSDILNAGVQNFSSSFQVRWGQFGLQRIRDNEEGVGQTIDDIRLYEAIDDVAMIDIDTPIVNSCGLSANVPVRITIRNTSPNTLNNIPVRLIVNGSTVATETIVIPGGLAPNTNFDYTFTATANLSAIGSHIVEVITMYPTDNFADNNSFVVTIINTPRITTFPYLETFESGNGNWYSGGTNNSWEYGTPASLKINNAASGTKAWKTSLAGKYNNSELSYLYSPCFDVTGMTNPTLSMNVALDLEDCGNAFCDGAYVEYSPDGKTWTRLGSSATGTNWYNKSYAGNNLWSVQDYANWHVATTPLPAGFSSLRLRIVVSSDAFVTMEGIGIDDIHVYDNTMGIYDGVTMGSPVNQNIAGGTSWVHFTSGGKLVASIQPNNQSLGSTDVQAYINTGGVRNDGKQYYHDRNITIKPATTSLADSVTVRFYFLDTETEALIDATGCGACTKPRDVTDLGVTKYADTDDNAENGTIADNINGTYSFLSADWNHKIPFDKGYYVEFKVRDFSEFWLNNGYFDRLTALPVELINFSARKDGNNAIVEWITASEQNVDRFEIEVARGNSDFQSNRFEKIGHVFSPGNSNTTRNYSFIDTEPGKSGTRYYRLKIIDRDGRFEYSPVRPLLFSKDFQWQVYPNPSDKYFNVMYQAEPSTLVRLTLYDATGKVIMKEQKTSNGFLQKAVVDLSAKGAGMYLLTIQAGEELQSFKLMKK